MTSTPAGPLSDAWLKRYRPAVAPRARLVCLPHGGGTAAFFRPWVEVLPADVELVAVQYPGRHDRLTEGCVTSMDAMADAVTAAIEPVLDRPFALFGHSMGATIGYEVVLRLEAQQVPPVRLFASGQRAPRARRAAEPQLHLVDDAAMLAGVGAFGGMYETLLADPDLAEFILPSLRGDLRLMETYAPAPGRQVSVPVTACTGDADPGVSVEEAAAWERMTTGEFELRTYTGGHFFLMEHRENLVGDLLAALTPRRP
ncbi:thioesterase II family protein [Streptomyces sp. NPDC088812]|uniref:thioesterase II family protein n=1 Tax=Streptomyces sp. NPDC088812 TaxID=3365905 RepID=UPI0037F7E7BD